MKYNKAAPFHPIVSEAIEFHADKFIAGLEAEGYARASHSRKRTALRRFLLWQRRRPPGNETDESGVARFLSHSFRLGPKHRCLASTALCGFLEYLRRHGVVATIAPETSETISSALERRYRDYLRCDKGLSELSLREGL